MISPLSSVLATACPSKLAPIILKIAPTITAVFKEKTLAATPGAIISSLDPAAKATANARMIPNRERSSSIMIIPSLS